MTSPGIPKSDLLIEGFPLGGISRNVKPKMGGKIDFYFDVVSPYSYMAYNHLLKNEATLASHNITIEYHPIFLGGIMQGSGNKPPWTLPAKATYGTLDFARSKAYFSLPSIATPSFFPILSLLPQRLLTHLHHQCTTNPSTYPLSLYKSTISTLFAAMWTPPNTDISQPSHLLSVLVTNNSSEENAKKLIEAANLPETKAVLNATTKKALDQGAFGAPWMLVTNASGASQPFFGSDRFHYMWEFLGVPWRDFELLPKSVSVPSAEKSGRKAKL